MKVHHICRICWVRLKEKKFHRAATEDCQFTKNEWLSYVQISNKVFNSGLYNFEGLKIKLPVFWNIDTLETMLENYHDKEIIKFLKYGWPISHDGRWYNTEKIKNWKGALINKQAVKAYLENELKFKSVIWTLQIKSIQSTQLTFRP